MPQPIPQEVLDSPTYWFAVMEGAKTRRDFVKAQEALEQLRRLGVDIRFSQQRPHKPKGGNRAS
jgi:hypothetical protein